MPRQLYLCLVSTYLVFSQSLVTAKPFHRGYDTSHYNRDLSRRKLLDPANGFAAGLLKAWESRPTMRDPVPAYREPNDDIAKRQENGSSQRGWGGWRSWGTYAATKDGNYVNDVEGNTKLNQLLNDFDSSFEALLNYFADEYQFPSQTSGGSQPGSATSQLSPPQAPPASTSQPPNVVFDPFPSIQPLPPPSAQPSSQVNSPTPAPSPNANASSGYRFDSNRSDLTAVYYAQSPATPTVPLPQLCSDASIDIIILAFVSHFFTSPSGQPSKYPTLNLASKCWAANTAQTSAGANGLIDCVSDGFAGQVAQCQQAGKKVLLSLGGSQGYSNTEIPNEEKAVELGDMLWGLFLGGSGNETLRGIRPFGAVVLDGIDIGEFIPGTNLDFLVA